MPVSERLYAATLHHTRVVDYGYSVDDLANGRVIPPSGARIDIAFEGRIEGSNLKGTIVGVDFGSLRADGRFQINIQATIITDDGATIALVAGGVANPSGGPIVRLRKHAQMTTAAPEYA
jgi:hypothetical protein